MEMFLDLLLEIIVLLSIQNAFTMYSIMFYQDSWHGPRVFKIGLLC